MLKIGVIGPNQSGCSEELYKYGVDLGSQLAATQSHIICGGMGGFMEAICKGVKQSVDTFKGQTVGILPGETAVNANNYVDLAIPTGLGIARNIIIINSSDIIIAAGGGAGTLSELAFAWQKKKKVLCITEFGGWAEELSGRNLDGRIEGLLVPIETIEEILTHIDSA